MEQEALLRTIGQNVFRIRKEAGLTQDQLAERTGLTTGTISKIERGSMAVMTVTLYNIAQALHVTCDALLYPPTPDNSLRGITHLLAGLPGEFLDDMEHIIRYCVENFEHKFHADTKCDRIFQERG